MEMLTQRAVSTNHDPFMILEMMSGEIVREIAYLQ